MRNRDEYKFRVVQAAAGYFEQAGRSGAQKNRHERKNQRGSAIPASESRTAGDRRSLGGHVRVD